MRHGRFSFSAFYRSLLSILYTRSNILASTVITPPVSNMYTSYCRVLQLFFCVTNPNRRLFTLSLYTYTQTKSPTTYDLTLRLPIFVRYLYASIGPPGDFPFPCAPPPIVSYIEYLSCMYRLRTLSMPCTTVAHPMYPCAAQWTQVEFAVKLP